MKFPNGAQVEHHAVDVCVVGGGMAGMCTAIAAARQGAKTAIVQDRPVFGGNASSEVRMWICGAHGKQNKEAGILEEILLENAWRNPSLNYSIWDSVLYEKIAYQPNLQMFLNTSCVGCDVQGKDDTRRINAITCWQLSSQLWHTIEAKVFVDCSGDSILATSSGAEFRTGRESREEFDENIQPDQADQKTMGNSILVQLRNTDTPQPFKAPRWAHKFERPEDLPHRIRGVQASNFWWIELGGLEDTIRDAEKIRDDLLRAAWGVWDYIKNRAPEKDEAECWALEWLGSLPGKRENRRYMGDHILTQNDIRAGGVFDDIVAYGGWSMDDHHPAGLLYPGKPTLFHPAPSPFGIPYRSLYSRNVENLMFAGRNISVTHAGLSATRVMATCAVIGQAVGTAAGMAVEKKITPRSIYPNHMAELQQTLMEDDAYLPGRARAADPLALQADGAPGVLLNGHERALGEASNAKPMRAGEAVTYTWKEPVQIDGARMVFDSQFENTKRMPCSYPKQGDRCLVPPTLAKAFRVEAQDNAGDWKTVYHVDENYQRLVHVPIRTRAKGLRLILEATWGHEELNLFAFEPQQQFRGKRTLPPEGSTWQEVIAEVDPKDLAAPESGLEEEDGKKVLPGA